MLRMKMKGTYIRWLELLLVTLHPEKAYCAVSVFA